MLTAFRSLLHNSSFFAQGKDVVVAYDIWSDSYDCQPGNLMLDLDELIFAGLIKDMDLRNKKVADIGCGTGRHWQKIYEKTPAILLGFDVSPGMLHQLIRKFPYAETQLITDNLLKSLSDSYIDCLITTLTIAHIKNIEEAISSWTRVLKDGGDLIITDFHPSMLTKGGKRSFKYEHGSLSVINYIHPLEKVKKIFRKHGFHLIRQEERIVDEEVRVYYEAQNALPVYYRFQGIPIIYGLHLKKQGATE
ncbi:MAG TPA: methyltransferase domain-containing protein [Puia sp.]|jgi:ubiquinone/menaquinone biosynthesis C-methylase UbiE|nr:methyltransferase domain-containing protein [Puia sp.]